MNDGVQVTQAIVPALPLSYSPVVGEIGLEPITWRVSGVYARAVRVRRHSVMDPAGFEPAASAMPSRCAPSCASGPGGGCCACESRGRRFSLAGAHQDSNLVPTRFKRVALPMSYVYARVVGARAPSTGAARRPRT